MREIKFRGKPLSKDLGWQFGDILHVDYLPESVLIGGVKYDEYGKKFQSGILVHPDTIGQLTGLPEKHGKDIYEGDICHSEQAGGDVLIYWSKECAGFYARLLNEDYGDEACLLDDLEVIGNIHEKEGK